MAAVTQGTVNALFIAVLVVMTLLSGLVALYVIWRSRG